MINYNQKDIEYIHTLGSRNVVGYTLSELSKQNKDITAVYADVGTRFEIPQRMKDGKCLQIGIAEQSLICILGGLFHEGLVPFGIAYAPFITMRAADQIRMTVGEMGLGIKIIGGSAGFVSGNLGSASLCLDDVSMMRAIPNMVIIEPSDCLQTAKVIEWASKNDKPIYIRLTGGTNVMPIYNDDFVYEYAKSNVVCEFGLDAVLYGCGVILYQLIIAAKLLKDVGINVTVIDMHTIKPLDTNIIDRYSKTKIAFAVQEHNIIGGLGSAIAEYLVAINTNQKLITLGANDTYPAPDTYNKLCEKCGLTSQGIFERVKKEIEQLM